MAEFWTHRDCGGAVESELFYSDAEQDYYFPVCQKCKQALESGDLVAPSKEENTPLRMHIALTVLRSWNYGTRGFDAEVVFIINKWIDDGMKGPIPWPDSPFFADWAEGKYQNIDGYIGFRMMATLPKAEEKEAQRG